MRWCVISIMGPRGELEKTLLYKSLTQNWELCFLITPVKSTICSPSPRLTVSLVTSGNWLKIIITSNIYFSLYIFSSYVLGTVQTLSYILWNLNLATALWRTHFYFLHFACQETNLSKVKEEEREGERAGMQTQVTWPQRPCSYPLCYTAYTCGSFSVHQRPDSGLT